jgi:hypothetical protein
MKNKNKKGLISEYLPWLLIGLAILAVLLLSILLFKGTGFDLIDRIKNIFRGR